MNTDALQVSYVDEKGVRWTLRTVNVVTEDDTATVYMIWRPER